MYHDRALASFSCVWYERRHAGRTVCTPPGASFNAQSATIAGLALLVGGCFTPLDDSVGDTDAPACVYGDGCNGVQVHCLNGGADESGGGGGPQNYWWERYYGAVGDSFQICGPGVTDEVCCNIGATACWQKVYHRDQDGYLPSGGAICVGLNWPAEFDPVADWAAGPPGGYPVIEEEIRAECSAKCMNRDQNAVGDPFGPAADPVCEDENWSAIVTNKSWKPSQGYNCPVIFELNGDDPDGSEIPWELAGGSTAPMPLGCDLQGDCVDWFYPSVAEFVLTPDIAEPIDPETRHARYLAVESAGSRVELDLDMPGIRPGTDDGESLFGLAEFSDSECTDAVCPFYLASLSAYNTTDTWEIRVLGANGAAMYKEISNVQIDLVQSTLGVLDVGLGKVAFAPGSIRLLVTFDVDNQAASGSTFGNGSQGGMIENVDYVFANYHDGALTLSHVFPVQSGHGTLTLTVAADERPPVASHAVGAQVSCNGPRGRTLSAAANTSTDPDGDIAERSWVIDGHPCWGSCTVPFGSHLVGAVARDTRGAYDRSEPTWVYVAPGC